MPFVGPTSASFVTEKLKEVSDTAAFASSLLRRQRLGHGSLYLPVPKGMRCHNRSFQSGDAASSARPCQVQPMIGSA